MCFGLRNKEDISMMHLKSGVASLVAASSLAISLPSIGVAQPDDRGATTHTHTSPSHERSAAKVEIISEVRAGENTFQVREVKRGEGAWFEITRSKVGDAQPEIVFQDTALFTNSQNDGGAAVPVEAKKKLASDFAKRAIAREGGADAFSASLMSYEKYGVPLPTGLYRDSLIAQGVRFPAQ
jgi:hypothetical protein